MKKLKRLPLSCRCENFLRLRTGRVQAAADPSFEAARLWKFRKNRAFIEIRRILREMAQGVESCMYCEYGEATDIDHFWPKATYPLRAFQWMNYLLACSNCNSNYKRAEFPCDDSGVPLLLDPTVDDPHEHLAFLPESGEYVGLSHKGVASVETLGLSRESLCRNRRNAWVSLQELLARYVVCRERGDEQRAGDIRRTVQEHPFASLLKRLVELADHAEASAFIDQDCLSALRRYPEISAWGRTTTSVT